MFRLGYRLAFGRSRPRPTDWAAVLELWDQAARLGHDRAMFYTGVSYEHGNGVIQDLTQALDWYKKAADLGHEVAVAVALTAASSAFTLARRVEVVFVAGRRLAERTSNLIHPLTDPCELF